jgi:hypothetical protein
LLRISAIADRVSARLRTARSRACFASSNMSSVLSLSSSRIVSIRSARSWSLLRTGIEKPRAFYIHRVESELSRKEPEAPRWRGYRVCSSTRRVKVRITNKPREEEIDGVRLDRFTPGSVREVSPILGAWLITEGYAELEMRQGVRERFENFSQVKDPATRAIAADRPRLRRRSTDS